VQVIATFVVVIAKLPYAVAVGRDALQLDTTVAETANEAVEVAPIAGCEASTAPNKPRENATDEHLMDSFLRP
jgi:hypothetical protein